MKCKCGCGKYCKINYVHGHNRKGLILPIEQRKKMSESHKGYKFSDEAKNKMSNTRKNLVSMGELFSIETRLKMSKAGGKRFNENPELIAVMKELRAKQKFPNQNSTIEIKIQNFLEQLGIEYYSNFFIKEIPHAYRCDIFVPSIKLVIECDGDWWHGNLKKYSKEKLTDRILNQMEIDKNRNKELVSNRFNILRLWEGEIRSMELNDFKDKLNKFKIFYKEV